MKSATVVVALSLSAAGLGCCADYASGPTGAMFAPVSAWDAKNNAGLTPAPHPRRKVMAAVYDIQDRTGKLGVGPSGAEAGWMLAQALQEAGGGAWFEVVDRESLEILSVRPGGANRERPTAMRIDCVIKGVESATEKGGEGASLLGGGANSPYWRIGVGLELRSVDARTGASMGSVSVQEKLYAAPLREGGFKYAAPGAQLAARADVRFNSPFELAVREAMVKAVHRLALRGVEHRQPVLAAGSQRKKRPAVRRRPVKATAAAAPASAPMSTPAPAPQSARAGVSTVSSPVSSPVSWLTKMQAFGQTK
jgi:curli biogenesis system outer membrane secretion channel CsgG